MRCEVLAALLMSSLFIVTAAGCASSPEYLFNVDTTASLARFRTFGFFDEREPGKGAYQSVAHRRLKSAIVRELQARGYQRSAEPDPLVNIHLQRSEDAQSGQTASDYYSYREGRYAWRAGVPTVSGSYTDGTLNIEVVDPASRELLWEGIAVGSVSQRMYENLETTIDTVVAKLFEGFPKQSHS